MARHLHRRVSTVADMAIPDEVALMTTEHLTVELAAVVGTVIGVTPVLEVLLEAIGNR